MHKPYCVNTDGQLGDGGTAERALPTAVADLGAVEKLQAGSRHRCARLASRAVRCWGRGEEGQLGDGRKTRSPSPVGVQGLDDATAIFTGGATACARRRSSRLVCWGEGLGPVPTELDATLAIGRGPPLEGVREVTIGVGAMCVTRESGRSVCSGWPHNGMPANATTIAISRAPTQSETGGCDEHSCYSMALVSQQAYAILRSGVVRC